MIKNLFFVGFVSSLLFLSCRTGNDEVQMIDQKLRIYIDSQGQDMLNKNITGSYYSVVWNDVYANKDTAPVSYALEKDADTISYMNYLAGATRILKETSGETKIYESKIALKLYKQINTTTVGISKDTMILKYTDSPELFQINQVWYNGVLVFTKTSQGENLAIINK